MEIGGIRATDYSAGYATGRTGQTTAQGFAEQVKKAAGAQGTEAEQTAAAGTTMDYWNYIQEYKEEIFHKVLAGETEPTYQIGAQSFTQEEWDKLLEGMDIAAGVEASDAQIDLLLSETVQARFPSPELDEEGNPTERLYRTAIDESGIRCILAGEEDYFWEIEFTEEGQYQKAVEFLDWADDIMDNFRFSANETFWNDYLNDEMDVDAFQEFLEGTDNGVPNYFYTVDGTTHVDKEKFQWAKYMNDPKAATMLTYEEVQEIGEQKVREYLKSEGGGPSRTIAEAIQHDYPNWRTMTFQFVGESKVYNFYEYIEEFERRLAEAE